ncbi:ABC transporter substrate-binding protein [Nitratireductor sp. GZWM139]|uniref:ABC transporter substrate-binding protein n=1 Tax=Nitratireductor sp. GZWM139 TaxID=2950541 RepID=UPI0024BE663B|nr:ABC transporter substrate-binding protein [Nitratireductor sp. GZWM139]MDJ1466120.1 ABC transporter substrate-binding protein [Nitratireductor sp. GZWM139]
MKKTASISRRTALTLMGTAGVSLAMPAVLRSRAHASETPQMPEITEVPEALKGSGEVRVVGFGGTGHTAIREAYFEPFERLTGIKVIDGEGSDPNKAKAMVDTGNVEWDLFLTTMATIERLRDQGDYFEKVDLDIVDTANIPEHNLHEYGVDTHAFAHVIAYRSDVFPEGPKDFIEFWDTEKFPGPRTMPTGTGGFAIPPLVAALVADGVPLDQIYPIDIQRSFDSLSKIRDSVSKFWDAEAMPIQMLVDNEAPLAIAGSGRIVQLQRDGVPVKISWHGGNLVSNSWAIPKGAANAENARKFIAFATLPISQARQSFLIPNGFVNRAAAEYIPENILAELPTAPSNVEGLVPYDYIWWKENKPETERRWNEWILQ